MLSITLQGQFPGLTSLNLGDSQLEEAGLKLLRRVPKLKRLTLGASGRPAAPESPEPAPLGRQLSNTGLHVSRVLCFG